MTREQIANHAYRRRASATSEDLRQYRQPTAQADDDVYDDVWPPALPTSARRYQSVTTEQPPVIFSGKRKYVLHGSPPQQRQPPPPSKKRHHLFLPVIFGMLTMLALWLGGALLITWWNTNQDDIHYGRPRTYQTDFVVGHSDGSDRPSHFIAINYHRHVEIIEFPGGDTSKARIYQGPDLYGDGQDLAVVTLTFTDVNGDGKVDMIINVGSAHIVFINDNGQFRAQKPGE